MRAIASLLLFLALPIGAVSQRAIFFGQNKAPAGGGTHVFTVVQEATCSGGSTSNTCTFSATAAGDSLLLGCGSTDNGAVTTFTPSATNVLSLAQSGGWSQLSLISSITTGTTSITMNFRSFVAGACVIWEVAGINGTVDGTPPAMTLDTSYSGTGSATGLTPSTTTTHANDAIVCMVYLDATYPTVPTFSDGTGDTDYGDVDRVFQGLAVFMEFQKVSSTGSYSCGATWTGGSFNAGFGTAAFELS